MSTNSNTLGGGLSAATHAGSVEGHLGGLLLPRHLDVDPLRSVSVEDRLETEKKKGKRGRGRDRRTDERLERLVSADGFEFAQPPAIRSAAPTHVLTCAASPVRALTTSPCMA